MKSARTALLALAACLPAQAQLVYPPAQPGAAPSTSFCLKSQLREDEGRLYCNWRPNFAAACASTFPNDRYIEKGSLAAGPTTIGRCSDSDEAVIRVSNY